MIDPMLTIRVANRTIYLALGKAMTIALLSLLVGIAIYADGAKSAKAARAMDSPRPHEPSETAAP